MATYRCPKCGNDDRLHVTIKAGAWLIQDDDGNIQTDVFGDHDWDDDSPMFCSACGWSGTVKNAIIDTED